MSLYIRGRAQLKSTQKEKKETMEYFSAKVDCIPDFCFAPFCICELHSFLYCCSFIDDCTINNSWLSRLCFFSFLILHVFVQNP